MPEPVVTGVTVADPEVTGVESPEEPTETGNEIQDNSEQLKKLEAELREFTSKLEAEAKAKAELEADRQRLAVEIEEERKAKADAIAERDREIKVRKGIQSSTTQKLAELAALKNQLANQTMTIEKLDRMDKIVSYLAQRDMSDEDRERLNQQIEQERQRQELEQYREAEKARSQPRQQQAPELTPELKEALYKDYFSDFTNVDPFDLEDKEWHQYDATSDLDWFQRVRAEFERRSKAQTAAAKNSVPVNTVNDETAKRLAELEEQFKAQREEDNKKLAETQAALELARKEAEEAKRLSEEQLNRSKGMDREHTSVSEPAPVPGAKKALQQLPPASWLYGTPEQRKAYRDAMDNKDLRRQILGA